MTITSAAMKRKASRPASFLLFGIPTNPSSQYLRQHFGPVFPCGHPVHASLRRGAVVYHGQNTLTDSRATWSYVNRFIAAGFAQLRDVACDYPSTARPRLQHRHSKSFIEGRTNQSIATRIKCRQVSLIDVVQRNHAVRCPTL